MRLTRRMGIALTTAVMAGGLVTATSGAASASPVAPSKGAAADCVLKSITLYNDSGVAGYALWNADPSACANGDNLGAQDIASDGYSVVAHLSKPDGSVPDRVVSTSGHNAPYTAWKGGDLPEGAPYYMWGCLSKNGVESHCSGVAVVYA
ncbi:hypothetical protein ACGFRB_28080 [Streptomyces sp. NPDC048718]|uniref:hypothetical protein n=1 Tax=Streptomyces sp. NPDC048718 TaxID=3365587 RepID=UPI0037156A3D